MGIFPKAELKSSFPEPTPPFLSLPPHCAQSLTTTEISLRAFHLRGSRSNSRPRGAPNRQRTNLAPLRSLFPPSPSSPQDSSAAPVLSRSSASALLSVSPSSRPLEARSGATTSRQCPREKAPRGPPAACGRPLPPSAPAAPRAGPPRLSPPGTRALRPAREVAFPQSVTQRPAATAAPSAAPSGGPLRYSPLVP